MPMYAVDYSYNLPEYGTVELDAVDADEAEQLAMEHVKEIYDDVRDIKVDGVREFKDAR